MRKLTMRIASIGILGMGATALAVGPAQATSPSDLNCTAGSYNERVTATGACAWGHLTSSSSGNQSYQSIAMVVVDNKDDGVCAHVDYRLKGLLFTGATTVIAKACGYGKTAPAQVSDIPVTIAGGGVYQVQVRVCATGISCSGWHGEGYGGN